MRTETLQEMAPVREWRCGFAADPSGPGESAGECSADRIDGGSGRPHTTVVQQLCIHMYGQVGDRDYGWFFADGY